MTQPYWQTTTKPSRREYVQWPTMGQAARQLAVVLVIAMLWSALFAGFIGLTALRAEPAPLEIIPVAAATETPTLQPTDTPPSQSTATTQPATAKPEQPATTTPAPVPTETPVLPTDTPTPTEEPVPVSFSNNVSPIFNQRCLKCHGGEKMENDFSVQSYESVLKGSWNGTVLKPGDPNGSYLVELIESGEMPNKGPRLLPAQIEAIRAWIEAGAPNN